VQRSVATPRPPGPAASQPASAGSRKGLNASGLAYREFAVAGTFCRHASGLEQPDVFALEVFSGDHRATNTRTAGTRYLRWLRMGSHYPLLAERTASANSPRVALALQLPGDELSHIRKRPGRRYRCLVLVARCVAIICCGGCAIGLWTAVRVVTNGGDDCWAADPL